MSQLIVNDSFTPTLFEFKMLPPYIEEVQHTIQNGSTLVDIIAYKDRFELRWPYLAQPEYNTLMQVLYNITSPFFKIDYQVDGLQRVWDGVTAPSSSINTDVQRIRNMVVRKSFQALEHIKRRAIFYEVKIFCQES